MGVGGGRGVLEAIILIDNRDWKLTHPSVDFLQAECVTA